jgi:hypothetical protein
VAGKIISSTDFPRGWAGSAPAARSGRSPAGR